jgi:centractin
MAGSIKEKESVVGNRAQQLRGLLALNYPMAHGVVTDWHDMEHIWQSVYKELEIAPEDHPVLLTEAPLNPRRNRERAAQIFFESFNVPALFVSLQAVLSLYASGRTTGVVLDSGDGVSHCVPIYEGFAMPNAIQRVDLAGRDISEHLQTLLRKAGYNFITSAERDIVRDIKEKKCYVAYDPVKEEQLLTERNNKTLFMQYKLPDGNVLEIGPERFRAPEILFDPSLIGMEVDGIQHQLHNSILKCDVDMRKTLYSSIVLSGGSTLFTGFADRLLKEVHALSPKNTKVRIFAPEQRQYSTWQGGSILAALASFKNLWVSHKEYAEEGSNILHRKFFL